MRTRRQKIQLELASERAAKGEPGRPGAKGPKPAWRAPYSNARRSDRVVDGDGHSARQPEEGAGACPAQQGGTRPRRHDGRGAGCSFERPLPEIWFRLLNDNCQPQPVRRVKIPKALGGVRLLDVPTVPDRRMYQPWPSRPRTSRSFARSSSQTSLVSGSCPSGRLAPRFLQTPPRNDALALR